MKNPVVAAVSAAALAVGGIGAGAWLAFGAEGATSDTGICGGATYEIEIAEDDHGLELGFELQTSGPAQVWQVLVEQGGDPVLVGERTTDEDGELDLDAPVDADASPEFRVTATPPDDEPCVVRVAR